MKRFSLFYIFIAITHFSWDKVDSQNVRDLDKEKLVRNVLPTSVVITDPGPVQDGEQVRLVCTSSGSRPSASLTWVIRGVARTADKEILLNDSITSSTLIANITRDDDGTEVICKSNNPAAPDYFVTNSTRLTVYYPPTVSASLGKRIRPEMLQEGYDIYFTCSVTANPPVSSIIWYHEGKALNSSSRVVFSEEFLAIRNIDRMRTGRYKCSATNTLATVTSPSVNVRIQYAPVCQTSVTTYFIYEKPINVTCTVESYPAASSFYWHWNSSTDIMKTVPVREDGEHGSAQLRVEPIKSRQDRTLMCWAANDIGRQSRPCVFSVIAADSSTGSRTSVAETLGIIAVVILLISVTIWRKP